MPKECTHWRLAERQAGKLGEASGLGLAIAGHRRLYLLGAVVLDTPYYAGGRGADGLRQATQRIHDTTGNGFAVAARVLRAEGGAPYPARLAFAAGLCSHIVADAVFHPLIYYLAGPESGPRRLRATARHRALETGLDLLTMAAGKDGTCPLFRTLADEVEIGRQAFARLLTVAFGLDQGAMAAAARAIAAHGRSQALFFRRWPVPLLAAANRLLGGRLQHLLALSYVYQADKANRLAGATVRFRHPVSGEEREVSLRQMEEAALAAAAEVFAVLDGGDVMGVAAAVEGLRGPNLLTGIHGVAAARMRFFAENPA